MGWLCSPSGAGTGPQAFRPLSAGLQPTLAWSGGAFPLGPGSSPGLGRKSPPPALHAARTDPFQGAEEGADGTQAQATQTTADQASEQDADGAGQQAAEQTDGLPEEQVAVEGGEQSSGQTGEQASAALPADLAELLQRLQAQPAIALDPSADAAVLAAPNWPSWQKDQESGYAALLELDAAGAPISEQLPLAQALVRVLGRVPAQVDPRGYIELQIADALGRAGQLTQAFEWVQAALERGQQRPSYVHGDLLLHAAEVATLMRRPDLASTQLQAAREWIAVSGQADQYLGWRLKLVECRLNTEMGLHDVAQPQIEAVLSGTRSAWDEEHMAADRPDIAVFWGAAADAALENDLAQMAPELAWARYQSLVKEEPYKGLTPYRIDRIELLAACARSEAEYYGRTLPHLPNEEPGASFARLSESPNLDTHGRFLAAYWGAARAIERSELDPASAALIRLEGIAVRMPGSQRATAGALACRINLGLALLQAEHPLAPSTAELREQADEARAHYQSWLASISSALESTPKGSASEVRDSAPLAYLELHELLSAYISAEITLDPSADGLERALGLALEQDAAANACWRALDKSDLDWRKDWLAPDHGACLWLPTRRGAWVFAMDDQRLALWRLPAMHPLGRLAKQLADDLGALDEEPAGKKGAALHRTLIQLRDSLWTPALEQFAAPWKTLTVIAPANLLGLPLELLPLHDTAGLIARANGPKPFRTGERFAIQNWPSFSLRMKLADRAGSKGGGLPVEFVGLLAPSGSLEKIELGHDSVRRLLGPWYDRKQTRLLVQSTPDALEALLCQAHGPVHLVAHGNPSSDPRGVGVLVDGSAAGPEVWRAVGGPLMAPCIVLSVCGSDRGRLRGGGVWQGNLATRLLERGVGGVVCSQSDLHLNYQLALFEVFYRELASGAAPHEALRFARLEVSSQDPYSGLAIEAGLVQFVGWAERATAGPPPKEGIAVPWTIWLLGVLALGLLGWWFTRQIRVHGGTWPR